MFAVVGVYMFSNPVSLNSDYEILFCLLQKF